MSQTNIRRAIGPSSDIRSPSPPGRGGFGSRRFWFLLSFKFLAIVPLVAFFLIFAIYPLAELVRMAFSKVTLTSGQFLWSFNGIENFTKGFQDPIFGQAVVNSILFAVASTILTVVVGTVLALLVANGRIFRGVARNIFIWPAVIAPVAVSVVWLLIFDPQLGLLNKLLQGVGLPTQGWLGGAHTALAAVVVVDVWHWTPIVFVFVSAALTGIDDAVVDAARVDGASESQITRLIKIPLLMPTLAVVTALRVIMASKVFDEMYLLTHGGPGTATTVISLYIRNVFFDQLDLGYGAALGILVVAALIVIFLGTLLLRALTRRVR